eukprot:Gb_41390 [translate_table: standard]
MTELLNLLAPSKNPFGDHSFQKGKTHRSWEQCPDQEAVTPLKLLHLGSIRKGSSKPGSHASLEAILSLTRPGRNTTTKAPSVSIHPGSSELHQGKGVVYSSLGPLSLPDLVVSIDGELIAKMTGLHVESVTVDLREEAKGADKDWVMQKLYPIYNSANVWSKSNDFHISRIIDEGVKWAVRIILWDTFMLGPLGSLIDLKNITLLRRCMGIYSLCPLWLTICMEALGPPAWIEPGPQPQLNLYLCLRMKKGDKKDKVATAYLGDFYTILRRLNDGPKRSKKVLEYKELQ